MGPMRAAYRFVHELAADHPLDSVTQIFVDLYGSLALTGRGHGTDRAILLGLSGETPDRVDPDQVVAVIEDGILIISGRRVLPAELQNARIHRLELPQGRFERRILLPAGRYVVSRFAVHGCVGLRLSKTA